MALSVPPATISKSASLSEAVIGSRKRMRDFSGGAGSKVISQLHAKNEFAKKAAAVRRVQGLHINSTLASLFKISFIVPLRVCR